MDEKLPENMVRKTVKSLIKFWRYQEKDETSEKTVNAKKRKNLELNSLRF